MAEKISILLCGRDVTLGGIVAQALGEDFKTKPSSDLSAAALRPAGQPFDVILLDCSTETPETQQLWLSTIHGAHPSKPGAVVIAIVQPGDRKTVLQLMESGVYDTVTHPLDILELRMAIRRANRYRQVEEELARSQAPEQTLGRLGGMVGVSDRMQEVFALARKIAACDVSVLITGETGTGKELLARAIHRLSPRAQRPFVAFSCANLPETLVEDEIFGHERGAFTGAVGPRQGRLEAGNGGTIFLDEIGDLGFSVQPKFLRVLQEKTFERLGSNTPITVDLRTIFATHRDLGEMVRQDKFREDLYYRLNVVQIELPPLRERGDDIVFLAKHFLDEYALQFEKKTNRFSRTALRTLQEHSWPGNVRQLQNVIQRAVVLADSRTVEVWNLPNAIRNDGGELEAERGLSYEEEVRDFKRRLILRALRECGWRKSETARSLRVARGYLHRLISQLGIRRDEGGFVPPEIEGAEPASRQVM